MSSLRDYQEFNANGWLQRVMTGLETQKPIKLYIAGDKSQVGKSSCCLGIIGSCLKLGFKPSELAYIKPVTQCEEKQLVVEYCEKVGVEAVGVGPVVFYTGFTRAFLDGNTKDSDDLLKDVINAVNHIASNKRLVLVDGVGFPAVGSIVGLSNATIAKALDAPVLLVCPKGVGNAVDSFNLNEAYFAHNGCKVLGSVFSRFALEGYYQLDKCRDAITSYFTQYRTSMSIYGFIPEIDTKTDEVFAEMLIKEYIARFNCEKLLKDTKYFAERNIKQDFAKSMPRHHNAHMRESVLDREQITKKAKLEGALSS